MKIVITFIALLSIHSCTPSYSTKGFYGGYSDTQLSDNMFRVSYYGNGYTGYEYVDDMALLRSADLALQNGFFFFEIMSDVSDETIATYKTPTQAYSNGNTTNIYGGQTSYIKKPAVHKTIVCHRNKPETGIVMDAEQIKKSISEKHGLEISTDRLVEDEKSGGFCRFWC
jgi:hypothetical protein